MPQKTSETVPVFDLTLKSFEEWCKGTSKQTEDIGKQLKEWMDEISKQLTTATDKIIKTEFTANGSKISYMTTINSITGNVTSNFPTAPASEEDIYWKLHMKLVDETLTTRKELQLKIIETVGTTVKGLFNPISVSNIDLVQIIQAILSSKK